MNFLSQMLPGFRHVRAPLISGYIWLFVAWLLLAGDLPHKHESAVYRHAYELGEAVGPVGLAVVASVAAYLVGSLVQIALSSIADGVAALRRNRFRRHWYASVATTITVSDLLAAPLFEPEAVGLIEGDGQTKSRLRSLTESQLAESQNALENAFATAEGRITEGLQSVHSSLPREEVEAAMEIDFKSEAEPIVRAFVVDGPVEQVSASRPEEPGLPTFSAARNMFEEKSAIKTLLMETTAQAGSEVERLSSEAELRFAISLPLAALAITLWAESGDAWWLALLVGSMGLLLHALVLNKHGGLELVEALRSREPEELDKISPVFKRYKSRATGLAGEIENFSDWEEMARQLAQREVPPTQEPVPVPSHAP